MCGYYLRPTVSDLLLLGFLQNTSSGSCPNLVRHFWVLCPLLVHKKNVYLFLPTRTSMSYSWPFSPNIYPSGGSCHVPFSSLLSDLLQDICLHISRFTPIFNRPNQVNISFGFLCLRKISIRTLFLLSSLSLFCVGRPCLIFYVNRIKIPFVGHPSCFLRSFGHCSLSLRSEFLVLTLWSSE